MKRLNRIAAALVALTVGVLSEATTQATLTWGANGNGGSGTWDTTSANWWNGTTPVQWDGSEAIFAGPGGTVTLSGSVPASQLTFTAPGYDLEGFLILAPAGGLTLDAEAEATVGATIFADTASGAFKSTLTKTGAALLTISDSPAFFGTIAVAAGELRFANGGSLNGTASYTLADSPGVVLSFSYDGEAVTNLSGGGSSGGIVRPVDLGGSKTLTIYGGGATFAGSLQDNGGTTLGLEKSSGAGPGTTQTLSGANTYSGATLISGGTLAFAGNGSALNTSAITIRQSAKLLLDNSDTPLATRINATASIISQGGTISLQGNDAGAAVFEKLGTLTFSGATGVSVDIAASGDSRLTFAGLTRSNLGTVHFAGGNTHVAITGAANTNGILGAYATMGDDWATVTSLSGGYTLAAFTAYATDITTAASTANVLTNGGTLTTSATRNSIKLIANGLYLNSSVILTLSSGGILSSDAPDVSIIGNGKLTSTSSSNELIVTNSNHLTIGTTIANTTSGMALTKSGVGTLTLKGTNTYTGNTVINQGTLEASWDGNLGSGTQVFLSGGTLRALNSFTSVKMILSGTGTSGSIDTNGYDLNFVAPSSATLIKEGAGKLTFSSSSVSNSVAATVNAGTLALPYAKSGSATLNSARLEAAGTLSVIYSSGGSAIAPGGSNAGTLNVSTLQLNAPTTFEFDLGTGGSDFLAVTSEYRGFSGSADALFDFQPNGGIDLGTPYAIMSFSGYSAPTSVSPFALSPDLLAAGWQADFTLAATGSATNLSVTFSAIPEPSPALLLLAGAIAFGSSTTFRRHSR
jgi:autotransporter-associated beta strand protein